MVNIHPFAQLRREVKQAGKQYRHQNDNSESLFHPDQGFVYAYDILAVEAALDVYEKTLPEEFQLNAPPQTLEEQLLQMAEELAQTHDSMQVRDFARTLLGYMAQSRVKDSEEEQGKINTLIRNLEEAQ